MKNEKSLEIWNGQAHFCIEPRITLKLAVADKQHSSADNLDKMTIAGNGSFSDGPSSDEGSLFKIKQKNSNCFDISVKFTKKHVRF